MEPNGTECNGSAGGASACRGQGVHYKYPGVVPFKEYGRYGSVGLELLLSMALGYYGGRWIDARVGGHGWITLVGFLAGVAVGFRAIFQAGKAMQRDIERAERRDRGEDPWSDERDLTDSAPPRTPRKPPPT
jgi:hypothetical protein